MFHHVRHFGSFHSAGCANKVFQQLFTNNFHCGATKSAAITKNVLAPYGDRMLRNDLDMAKYVSIHFDASNRRTTKMFPVLVKFFDPKVGIKVRFLEMYSIKKENAVYLVEQLVDAIEKIGCDKVVSLCADNASVNFGGINEVEGKNVRTLLEKHLGRKLVAVNCSGHISNNSLQDASKRKVPIPIQSILGNMYDHFKISTTRSNEFLQLLEKAGAKGIEIIDVLPRDFSPTRWLSSLPGIDRVVLFFVPYGRYFDLPDHDTDKNIDKLRQFFYDKLSFPWLLIMQNVAGLYHRHIKAMERQTNTAVDTAALYNELMKKVNDLADSEFVPPAAEKIISEWPDEEQQKMKQNVIDFYANCAEYMQDWKYEWMDGIEKFDWMNLEKQIDEDRAVESLQYFSDRQCSILSLLNEEDLRREIRSINSFIEAKQKLIIWNAENSAVAVPQRWVEVFSQFADNAIPNLLEICCFMFSLPSTNAIVERLFSEINWYWTKNRGGTDFDTVKAVFSIRYNITYDCLKFIEIIKESDSLIAGIRSQEKYKKKREKPKDKLIPKFEYLPPEPLPKVQPAKSNVANRAKRKKKQIKILTNVRDSLEIQSNPHPTAAVAVQQPSASSRPFRDLTNNQNSSKVRKCKTLSSTVASSDFHARPTTIPVSRLPLATKQYLSQLQSTPVSSQNVRSQANLPRQRLQQVFANVDRDSSYKIASVGPLNAVQRVDSRHTHDPG